ncbi:MAG: hypothetical protein LBL31_02335 [Spirochaetaceae bacterium]|nr:hypothetical protein [Spirochaetaceae bacterium]
MKVAGRIGALVFLWAGLPLAAADGPVFSGLFEVKAGGGMSDTGEALSGVDVYANLRLREQARENLTFYAAFNAQAAAGMFAVPQAGGGGALFEAERLYLRWAEERWGLDAGLMPLHFGYGQVFAPSDFLIRKNPAVLDARPRGVSGAAVYQYPHDAVKLTGFAVFPSDVRSGGWEDIHCGAAFEAHTARASFQALYAYQTGTAPGGVDNGDGDGEGGGGVHFVGASVKIDAGVGLLADGLYRIDRANRAAIDAEGLALSAGADYTFGKLYVLAEYLYNGNRSVSRQSAGGAFRNRAFVGATLLCTVSDLTNVAAQGLWSVDDGSLLPSLVFSHDLAQGFTLSVSAQIPLDLGRDNDSPGELGPETAGKRLSLTAGLRLRL